MCEVVRLWVDCTELYGVPYSWRGEVVYWEYMRVGMPVEGGSVNGTVGIAYCWVDELCRSKISKSHTPSHNPKIRKSKIRKSENFKNRLNWNPYQKLRLRFYVYCLKVMP